jgi:hypothetical protein
MFCCSRQIEVDATTVSRGTLEKHGRQAVLFAESAWRGKIAPAQDLRRPRRPPERVDQIAGEAARTRPVRPVTIPKRGDSPAVPYRFFLMTDERSPEGLEYLRRNGAVLVQDLLQPEDRQVVGWPVIVTDVLALVEQSLAARCDGFVGQAWSTVASGVVAIRAARGLDPATAILV